MKLLPFILLLSFNCFAQELNECGMTREECLESDIRCFEVRDEIVYESFFGMFGMKDRQSIITTSSITLEELETDYEKVD
jgi:hypothetical protein